MALIPVIGRLEIHPDELEERFVRSSGPGGQNVNKVSTAVELRFALWASPSLPSAVKERVAKLAGRRLTDEGIIVIQAGRHRTQERNRADARERLFEMIREAAVPPVRRVATKPSYSAKLKRVESKVKRGSVKKLRQSRIGDD
jgi:ribosome-associated protein